MLGSLNSGGSGINVWSICGLCSGCEISELFEGVSQGMILMYLGSMFRISSLWHCRGYVFQYLGWYIYVGIWVDNICCLCSGCEFSELLEGLSPKAWIWGFCIFVFMGWVLWSFQGSAFQGLHLKYLVICAQPDVSESSELFEGPCSKFWIWVTWGSVFSV